MRQKMPPFRRKKSNKSFPVKVCTLDAELEFNLEVSTLESSCLSIQYSELFTYMNPFSGELLGEIYSI